MCADRLLISDERGQPDVRPLSGSNLEQERAMQALMQPSRQSVEEVKRVVAEARHKVQRPPTNINGTFNEEDFMDGDLVDEDMA